MCALHSVNRFSHRQQGSWGSPGVGKAAEVAQWCSLSDLGALFIHGELTELCWTVGSADSSVFVSRTQFFLADIYKLSIAFQNNTLTDILSHFSGSPLTDRSFNGIGHCVHAHSHAVFKHFSNINGPNVCQPVDKTLWEHLSLVNLQQLAW